MTFSRQAPLRRARTGRPLWGALTLPLVAAACNTLFGFEKPTLKGETGEGGEANSSGGVGGTSSGAAGLGGAAGGTPSGSGGGAGTAAGRGGAKSTGGTSGTGSSSGTGAAGDSGTAGDSGAPDVGGSAGVGGASGGASGVGGASGTSGTTSGQGGSTSGASGGGTAGSAGKATVNCSDPMFKGGELVLVPAGSVMIGASDLTANTLPIHGADFDDFCIDRTEVTVSAYSVCAGMGGCADPDTVRWPNCNWTLAGRENHPVDCIDWARADAFCRWANKRLPTEKEWEYAARGSAGRKYPWGSAAPTATLLNWNDPTGTTKPVGSYPAGDTPMTGLKDMGGNVWEWTGSIWCDTYDANATCDTSNHVARGGSYASAMAEFVRPAWRDPDSAGDERFGFRCAYGPGEVK